MCSWTTSCAKILVAACAIATQASATDLIFDFEINLAGLIPDDYGDRVTATSVDVGGGEFYYYGSAGGFTPNVVVDYISDSGSYTRWETGYGDLLGCLGHSAFNVDGEIVLTPDPGFDVILESFDVGAWNALLEQSRIRVLDEGGAVLFDTGLITLTTTGHETYPPAPIRSGLALRIIIDDFGDVGIDNIQFAQDFASPPLAFDLLAPANGATGLAIPETVVGWPGAVRPSLAWEGMAGTGISYGVCIATDPGLTSVVLKSSGFADPRFELPNGVLLPDTTYYWQAETTNTIGSTSSTSVFDFTTAGGVLGCDGDSNGDFVVNFADITRVLARWLQTCP